MIEDEFKIFSLGSKKQEYNLNRFFKNNACRKY